MEHFRASNPNRRSQVKTGTFTGDVWGESRVGEDGLMMNAVLFAPGARSYWHRHEDGQILHVTAGQGHVGTRDGTIVDVSPGDVVWAPPGEEHYHGATADSFLLHDAISFGEIEWLDEVTDDDCGR